MDCKAADAVEADSEVEVVDIVVVPGAEVDSVQQVAVVVEAVDYLALAFLKYYY